MLKFTYLVQLGLVGVVALPGLQRSDGSLEQALIETERALAALVPARGPAGGKESATRDDYAAVARALEASERPIGTPRGRDELLERLRRDVGRLQQELDEVEFRAAGVPLETAEPAEPDGAGGATPPRRAPAVGLDDALRERLARSEPPIEVRSGSPDAGPSLALEEPGYSADPIRHGRAYFRAGRYAEGLALLERSAQSPEAAYWRARCLERLGRVEEALAIYAELSDAASDTPFAPRAARDLEFITWLRSFEQRLDERRQP